MTFSSSHPHSIGVLSPKGGVGVTVVASALAVLLSEREQVDLLGTEDTAAALGVAVQHGVQQVTPALRLHVRTGADTPDIPVENRLVLDHAVGALTLMVLRPCYLALRRVAHYGFRPDGVILVQEPGRALTASDVERVAGAKVLATVPFDPMIPRCVDAGLLATRLPLALRSSLEQALENLAIALR